MKRLARFYSWSVLALFLLTIGSTEARSAEAPAPGSSEVPVTTERLTGALLEYHRSDPKLVWSFTEDGFVLEIGGKTVPRELIATLTGNRSATTRIEGTWKLDEEQNVLELTTLRVDERALRYQSQLSIFPAGMVRVDLGDYQYNVFPNAAKNRVSQPKLAFRQEGDDLFVSTTIEIVDAPHVLWTHSNVVMDHDPYLEGPRRDPILDRVDLSYTVIQCRDDPYIKHMRHQKKSVDITWRLNAHRKADVPYRVIEQFNPSADELLKLAPKLERIAEETRERRSLSVP